MQDSPVAHAYAPTTAGDLLDLVRRGEATTRAALARRTGLSRTAVSARVSALTDLGVLTTGRQATTGGRPAETLTVAPDAGRVVALAVGRSRSQVGVVDLAGEEVATDEVPHEGGTPPPPEALLPDLVRRATALLGRGDVAPLAVGLSLAAAVDDAAGVVRDSLVLTAWEDTKPADHLGPLAALPVVLGNDADVMASAELSLRPGLLDGLVVKASTGIGAGIITAGRVAHGHRGAAGELGHVRLPAADGRLCRCGGTGCLESLAAGWALIDAWEGEGRPAHVRDLVAAARDGHPGARALLAQSSRHLGEALAAAVNLLNPEVLVIGGDMGATFDLYTAGLREAMWPRLAPTAARSLRIEPSLLGDRAGLVGAATVALDRVLSPAGVDAWLTSGRPVAVPR